MLHPVKVLDTRANAAAAVLRRLEGEARLLEEDTGGPEEMSDLSGGAKSPLQVLKGQIAIARVDVAHAEVGTAVEVGQLDGHQKRLTATVCAFPHFDPTKERVKGNY